MQLITADTKTQELLGDTDKAEAPTRRRSVNRVDYEVLPSISCLLLVYIGDH